MNKVIFTTILDAFTAMTIGLLTILPTLPPLPAEITTMMSYTIGIVNNVIPILHYMYGTALFNAILFLVVALWQIENIYAITMWVLRKIPFINIK